MVFISPNVRSTVYVPAQTAQARPLSTALSVVKNEQTSTEVQNATHSSATVTSQRAANEVCEMVRKLHICRSMSQEGAGSCHNVFDSSVGANTVAQNLLDKAKAVEPFITKFIKETSDRYGGELYGLDCRLKTAESLSQKLEKTKPEWITDALRYTMKFVPDNLGQCAQHILDSLGKEGYKSVVISNCFKRGGPYVGINATLQSPAGQIFELQFHTPESLAVKETNHSLYKQYQALAIEDPLRQELMQEMIRNAHKVNIPDGIQQDVPSARNY